MRGGSIGAFPFLKIMEQEIWKPVVGYESNYEVSNFGRVKTIRHNVIGKDGRIMNFEPKIKKPSITRKGYYYVNLSKNGKKKCHKIHKLVMEAFVPNSENKPYIDHINTIKTDNRVCNLRWVSSKENTQNPLTMKHIIDACATNECKEKQRQTKKKLGILNNRPIEQYTMDWVFVASFDSIAAAARSLKKIKPRQIGRNIKLAIDNANRSAYGYRWRSRRIEPLE